MEFMKQYDKRSGITYAYESHDDWELRETEDFYGNAAA